MRTLHITLPFSEVDLKSVRAGDRLLLSGRMYTARDEAHRRIVQYKKEGADLPINFQGETIYYVGPAPAKPGQVINSAGPTTAKRMDKYTQDMLELGVVSMIGKGERGEETRQLLKGKAIYMAALGGVGAKQAQTILEQEEIAFHDAGMESLRRLEVKDFPVIVINDWQGNDAYELGRTQWTMSRQ
ncbi:MAG: fumarate hydratase C-terminal domain-containing protein [Candidatus Altimarinota bacterium]